MSENNCDGYIPPFIFCPTGSWSTDGTIYGLKSDGSRGCDSLCPLGTTVQVPDPSIQHFLFKLLTESNCTLY